MRRLESEGNMNNKLTVFYDHIRNAMKQENMTFDEIAKKLTNAGISGVEIEYTEICDPTGKYEFANMLKNAGLPISAVYCHFHWEYGPSSPEYVNYEEVLQTLKDLDIHYLLAIPGFLLPNQSEAEAMEYFAPLLSKLCEAAKEKDITITMEDFDATVATFGTGSQLKWYFEHVPNLRCAFDTGNFMFFGEDSYEVLKDFVASRVTDKIAYVHCKDRSLTPVDGEDFTTTVDGQDMYSSAVGSGVIKMSEILHTLKALTPSYSGPIAIEHFGSLKQLEDMLTSAKFIRSI